MLARPYHVPNDQDTAKRVLANLGVHKLERDINIGRLLILNPLVKVARSEDDIVQQPTTLRDHGLETRLVQVQGASFDDLLLMVFEAARRSVHKHVSAIAQNTYAQ